MTTAIEKANKEVEQARAERLSLLDLDPDTDISEEDLEARLNAAGYYLDELDEYYYDTHGIPGVDDYGYSGGPIERYF